MEDYSFNFTRAIIGVLVSAALIGTIYTVVMRRYMDFDMSGYSLRQTKSGVYHSGYTLEELTGENLQGRIFTPAHVVMFPAVDNQTDFGHGGITGGIRMMFIYERLNMNHMQLLPYPSNSLRWTNSYNINLAQVQTRSGLFRSFIEGSNGITIWNDLVRYAVVPGSGMAENRAFPQGGWFGVVNGYKFNGAGNLDESRRTDWLLYRVEQPSRLIVPHAFGGP